MIYLGFLNSCVGSFYSKFPDCREGQEEADAVDAQRADRVADEVAEEGVFMFRRLDHLALARIDSR